MLNLRIRCDKLSEAYHAMLRTELNQKEEKEHQQLYEPHLLIAKYIKEHHVYNSKSSPSIFSVVVRMHSDISQARTYEEKCSLQLMCTSLEDAFDLYMKDFKSHAYLYIENKVRFQPEFISSYCQCITFNSISTNDVFHRYLRNCSTSPHFQLLINTARALQIVSRIKTTITEIKPRRQDTTRTAHHEKEMRKIEQSQNYSEQLSLMCSTLRDDMIEQVAAVKLSQHAEQYETAFDRLFSYYTWDLKESLETMDKAQASMVGLGNGCEQRVLLMSQKVFSEWIVFMQQSNKDMKLIHERIQKQISQMEEFAKTQWLDSVCYSDTEDINEASVEDIRALWMKYHLQGSVMEEHMVQCLLSTHSSLNVNVWHDKINQVLLYIAHDTDTWIKTQCNIKTFIDALQSMEKNHPVPALDQDFIDLTSNR